MGIAQAKVKVENILQEACRISIFSLLKAYIQEGKDGKFLVIVLGGTNSKVVIYDHRPYVTQLCSAILASESEGDWRDKKRQLLEVINSFPAWLSVRQKGKRTYLVLRELRGKREPKLRLCAAVADDYDLGQVGWHTFLPCKEGKGLLLAVLKNGKVKIRKGKKILVL